MTACGEYLRKRFVVFSRAIEFIAGLPHAESLVEAARTTSTLAEGLRYPCSDHPALASQVPDKPGPVDALPFGVAKVHVGLKDRRVVRQGAFSGAQEVKA